MMLPNSKDTLYIYLTRNLNLSTAKVLDNPLSSNFPRHKMNIVHLFQPKVTMSLQDALKVQ